MAFVIVPIIAIVVAWLIHSIISLGQFLCDILLGLGVLMWFIISFLGQIIYNCWWSTASAANNLGGIRLVWGTPPDRCDNTCSQTFQSTVPQCDTSCA